MSSQVPPEPPPTEPEPGAAAEPEPAPTEPEPGAAAEPDASPPAGPLPSASEELGRGLDVHAEHLDAGQQQRVNEAGTSIAEAKARTEAARATQAEAEAEKANAEARKADAEVKMAEIAAKQANADRKLRKKIAGRVFWAAAIQVVVADVGFGIYGWQADTVSSGTMNAWLGATVVQVIAVALVIARSLFPSK